ncbi:MAG: TRAP transporter substrate-binding protein DctP [Deltaproteobacteria bacterium]|nr:TRAP transporter substrate-binding protein DctP [Deltaproteobacteria bacterium]
MANKLRNLFCAAIGLMVLFATMVPLKADAKTITLKFVSPVPPKSWLGKQQKWWAQQLEKRTNGEVKVQFFWMSSLVKWKDALHGVASGVTDIACPCSTYHPSEYPLYVVLDMPYNGTDYWSAMMATIDTVENQPDLKAEFKKNGVKLLMNWMSGNFLPGTAKLVDGIKGMKGKTFRSFGGARIKWMENLGINPVFMSYADIYEALDRGTIDGVELVLMLSDAFKHYEVVKDLYLAKTGFVVTCAAAINLKVWNSLPKNVQDVMMKLRADYAAHYAEQLMALESNIIKKWKEKYGVRIQPLSPSDAKLSEEAGLKAQEYFLKKQESTGHPARKVWDYFQKRQEFYENQVKQQGYPWQKK